MGICSKFSYSPKELRVRLTESSSGEKTRLKMLFYEQFHDIRELEIYSWYFDHFILDTDHFQ